jgi:hypothetical protein
MKDSRSFPFPRQTVSLSASFPDQTLRFGSQGTGRTRLEAAHWMVRCGGISNPDSQQPAGWYYEWSDGALWFTETTGNNTGVNTTPPSTTAC